MKVLRSSGVDLFTVQAVRYCEQTTVQAHPIFREIAISEKDGPAQDNTFHFRHVVN